MKYDDVVVAGAGPAGSYCALELAKKGIYPTIFDNTLPREKPCGGAILPGVIERFPVVEQFRSQSGSLANLRIISPKNRQVTTNRFKAGFVVSRELFDNGIVNMATQNGAQLIEEKVLEVKKKRECWKIRTNKRILSAKILVGADGVNSIVRKRTVGVISKDNLAIACGYIVKGIEKEQALIKFVNEIPGYIWIFHRNNHSSIGIGSELKYGKMLKRLLDDFIRSYCPSQPNKVSRFSALLPSATDPDFFDLPCGGEDWLLVGDAAGHVDPISRDGILYALWSGKLAAEVIRKNELKTYDSLWRRNYGDYLRKRCKQKDAFYDPVKLELSIMCHSLYEKPESK